MEIKYFRNFGYIYKGFLGFIAYITFFPSWLCPLINKLRGTKIKNVRNVYIAPNVIIDSIFPDLVTIEEEVYITRGVKIITHTNYTPPIQKIVGKENKLGKVHIMRGAFIGVNSIILPGVKIGRCAIVASGAVVTKDVPDFGIAGGNPAKIIGDIRNVNEL